MTCPACGDEGVIDEAAARRLGVDLGDARTAWCPVCRGGAVEVREVRWLELVGLAAAVGVAGLAIAFAFAAVFASALGLFAAMTGRL